MAADGGGGGGAEAVARWGWGTSMDVRLASLLYALRCGWWFRGGEVMGGVTGERRGWGCGGFRSERAVEAGGAGGYMAEAF